jgi:predicted ATP-binding protein involved in virulence
MTDDKLKEMKSVLDGLVQLGDYEAEAIANAWQALLQGDIQAASKEIQFISEAHAVRTKLLISKTKLVEESEAQERAREESLVIESKMVN